MRLYAFLLCCVLTTVTLHAADDPFVGKWHLDVKKSQNPRHVVHGKDLGSNRYQFTNSAGISTVVVADGRDTPLPDGSGIVSFRPLDDHRWRWTFKQGKSFYDATWTMAPDGNTMKIAWIQTLPNGSKKTGTTIRRRIGGTGNGLAGDFEVESRSGASLVETEMTIAAFGSDGLSLTSPDNSRLDLKFDGKEYEGKGPTVPKGVTVSGKRINSHTFHLDSKLNGKFTDGDDFKLSPDGKTLTITSQMGQKGSKPTTSVYERE